VRDMARRPRLDDKRLQVKMKTSADCAALAG
jgi:hypothetical protein